jgi:putative ABC transport system permease protein
MILLLSLAIVGSVVLVFSIVSLLLSTQWSSLSWLHRGILVFGGPVDGMIGYALLAWLDLSQASCLAGGVLLGLVSMMFLQPMLMPQRLLVWRLAKENILRRRRQTALMLAGLVIASTIITSSLVVGDSLDATVSNEVRAAWGETDLLVSGIDPMTGVAVDFPAEVGETLWGVLQANNSIAPHLIGRQYGLTSMVSLTAPSGLAEPSVAFFARNASVDDAGIWASLDLNTGLRFSDLEALDASSSETHVALNQVAADMLEANVGDMLEMGVFITNDEQRVRTTQWVRVHAIVPNTGQGAMAGTLSPAIFAALSSAETLLGLEGRLNRLAFALDDDVSAQKVRSLNEAVSQALDDVLTAEDAGLVFTVDEASASLSISSQVGLQRIAGDDVVALRENRSRLAPDAAMLEVMQAPLIDAQVNDEALLTLADSEIHTLRLGDAALWHVASNGLGFELLNDGEAWMWQVEDGERVNDVAWNSTGGAAVVAYDEGLVLADERFVDEDERASYDTSNPAVAVTATEQGWLALLEEDGVLLLTSFDEHLAEVSTTTLSIPLPNTVLSYSLEADDRLYLAIEGLLTVDRYAADLGSEVFNAIDESEWPTEDAAPLTEAHEACDGVVALVVNDADGWCTWEHGLLRWNTTSSAVESLRLPVLSDAPGFGKYPQMVLAFGGDNASLSVEEGTILTSQRLALLNLEQGEELLLVKGILPYAYGNDSAVALRSEGLYAALPGFEQLADLDAVVLGLVHLNDAETLALAGDDDRSILMFSGPSFAEGNGTSTELLRAWFDERSTAEDLHLQTSAVQLDAAEQAEASSGLLSAMFLVFGTFTIAAGVLLSLTIIMLLADVRRKELATARALGLKRSDARAMFVLEGTAIALVSGAVGSLVGLGLAWVISVGFSTIFQSVGAQSFAFAWTVDSFFAGWIWGALLSLLLLSLSAAYNAQLNIVRALKDGRAPMKTGVPWGVFLAQIIGLGGLGMCGIGLVLFGFNSGLSYAAYVGAGVGFILLLTPIVTWQLPTWLSGGKTTRWTRYAARNTLGAVGVLFLVWTLVLAPIDPWRQEMEPNELSFIVLGLLQVLSGVMVLTSWAPMLVAALSKRRLFGGGPVRAVALAHPLAHPVRTAVVMGMFSITMFSVVVLAGYTEQFDTYSADFVEEAEGEFELLLTSSRARPITIGENPSAWGLNDSILDNIDAVGSVYRAPVHLEDEQGERMPYLLRGVDSGFLAHGGLPLHLWDESLGATSDEAWISIENFNDVVFLDASFGLESTADGSTLVPLQFSIGDSIFLIDFSNPQNTREVRVGGFLKQSSYIFSPGVWMHASVVEEQFNGEITRMYVSVSPDAAPRTEDFAEAPIAAQGKTVDERRAAAELEDLLDRELASKNINVQTVADEIMVIQSLVLAILSLFEGYLALGLVVGVAGIGVVTVRNVSERRRTVGMLRAIGFRQRHVWRMFSIEVSWVAVLGMLNGLVIGYGFHVVLYNALWKSEGVDFSFPWFSTLALFMVGWLVVLITTFIPVRQASNIPPSAALRTG